MKNATARWQLRPRRLSTRAAQGHCVTEQAGYIPESSIMEGSPGIAGAVWAPWVVSIIRPLSPGLSLARGSLTTVR